MVTHLPLLGWTLHISFLLSFYGFFCLFVFSIRVITRLAKGRKLSRNFPWELKFGTFGNTNCIVSWCEMPPHMEWHPWRFSVKYDGRRRCEYIYGMVFKILTSYKKLYGYGRTRSDSSGDLFAVAVPWAQKGTFSLFFSFFGQSKNF